MNMFRNALITVVMTFFCVSIVAQDKFIDRVTNESSEFSIYIVPFKKIVLGDDAVEVDPAYSVTAHTNFDVKFKEPIVINKYGDKDTGLLISVGARPMPIVVDLDEIKKGSNTLIVDKQGGITIKPSTEEKVETVVDPTMFGKEKDGGFSYKAKYITEIVNKSDKTTIHILPFWERYIEGASSALGYTVSKSVEDWRKSTKLSYPILIGVDELNSGLLVKVGGAVKQIDPPEFQTLKEKNILTVNEDGVIEVTPATIEA